VSWRLPEPDRRPDAYLARCELCHRYERPIWLHVPTGHELCHRCALAQRYSATDLERVI